MTERQSKITIIPPDGSEVPFERRTGAERLRVYGDPKADQEQDRRQARRSIYGGDPPHRIDLAI